MQCSFFSSGLRVSNEIYFKFLSKYDHIVLSDDNRMSPINRTLKARNLTDFGSEPRTTTRESTLDQSNWWDQMKEEYRKTTGGWTTLTEHWSKFYPLERHAGGQTGCLKLHPYWRDSVVTLSLELIRWSELFRPPWELQTRVSINPQFPLRMQCPTVRVHDRIHWHAAVARPPAMTVSSLDMLDSRYAGGSIRPSLMGST